MADKNLNFEIFFPQLKDALKINEVKFIFYFFYSFEIILTKRILDMAFFHNNLFESYSKII